MRFPWTQETVKGSNGGLPPSESESESRGEERGYGREGCAPSLVGMSHGVWCIIKSVIAASILRFVYRAGGRDESVGSRNLSVDATSRSRFVWTGSVGVGGPSWSVRRS